MTVLCILQARIDYVFFQEGIQADDTLHLERIEGFLRHS
jgi:hypothetical protein